MHVRQCLHCMRMIIANRRLSGGFVAILLLSTIAAAWFIAGNRTTAQEDGAADAKLPPTVVLPEQPSSAQLFDVEGVTNPKLLLAKDSGLRDDDLVIGVVAFGETHAYLTSAFARLPERHIVNDKFGDVPVTITHCDLTSCTRVLSSGEKGTLNVRCGGWSPEDGMALLVDEREFSQASKDIPLKDVSYVVTTWKEWNTAHPETKVYEGGQAAL